MSVTGWGGATTLWVEADFGQAVTDVGEPSGPTGNASWDLTTWDDGASVWAGRDPVWTDITASVRGISTTQSFSRQTNRWNTSSAEVTLDNNSGAFSPTNLGSPYRLGASTTIGLLRRMRIRARYYVAGAYDYSWTIYDGLIQSWQQSYPDHGTDAVVSVSLLGAESRLGMVDRPERTAQGAGESSGARVRRILADAGWPSNAPLDIDTGATTMQATTLSGSAMNELQLVADSEGGYFYFTPDGVATFDAYNAQIEKGRLQSPLLFSDGNDLIQTPIGYTAIEHSYNGDLVANVVNYQRVGGVMQTVTSPNSRSLYGDRILSRSDLITQSDAHVARIAARDLAVYRNPELRVDSLTFSPRTPTLDFYGVVSHDGWNALASGAISLRRGVRIRHTPRGEANAIERLCFIDGISHAITPTTWDVSLQFSSASAYENVGAAVFDGASGVDAAYADLTRWGW